MPYALFDSQTDVLLCYADDREALMDAPDGEWYIANMSQIRLHQIITDQQGATDAVIR